MLLFRERHLFRSQAPICRILNHHNRNSHLRLYISITGNHQMRAGSQRTRIKVRHRAGVLTHHPIYHPQALTLDLSIPRHLKSARPLEVIKQLPRPHRTPHLHFRVKVLPNLIQVPGADNARSHIFRIPPPSIQTITTEIRAHLGPTAKLSPMSKVAEVRRILKHATSMRSTSVVSFRTGEK